jgi:hypothetical protein
MKRLLPATLAALALSLAACSDPGEAYTPVDQLPSAQDDNRGDTDAVTGREATVPPPVSETDTEAGDTYDTPPMDEPPPMDPLPPPTDPEIPPMDPVPREVDEATRPPPVDSAIQDEERITPKP